MVHRTNMTVFNFQLSTLSFLSSGEVEEGKKADCSRLTLFLLPTRNGEKKNIIESILEFEMKLTQNL